jgi:AcrR family transcriptional regulator
VTESPSNRREELTRIALELLEAEGPEAVSTRKVAAAYGASTMAVYSEFGSLGGLVESVVDQGFRLLEAAGRSVPATDDPVADLVTLARAYVAFGRAHPHLYRVIYAVSPLGGHRRTGEELLQGAGAFAAWGETMARAYRAGRLSRGRPYDATVQLWLALHGQVLAELAGYLDEMRMPEEPLADGVVHAVVVAYGDAPEAATASIAAARTQA